MPGCPLSHPFCLSQTVLSTTFKHLLLSITSHSERRINNKLLGVNPSPLCIMPSGCGVYRELCTFNSLTSIQT